MTGGALDALKTDHTLTWASQCSFSVLWCPVSSLVSAATTTTTTTTVTLNLPVFLDEYGGTSEAAAAVVFVLRITVFLTNVFTDPDARAFSR
ncbi:hypothetical protein Pcinc_016346 [Petrolisthes cinctipes]|uniref:Uncharacterized protein n=1 Tax=Petrolisthes cinctipes TaxID=88211 RepID=A0AAE1FWG1_PETCI|nr:hypothetical protein Pcinc_016346 [Petrolisthes cinctipes]